METYWVLKYWFNWKIPFIVFIITFYICGSQYTIYCLLFFGEGKASNSYQTAETAKSCVPVALIQLTLPSEAPHVFLLIKFVREIQRKLIT